MRNFVELALGVDNQDFVPIMRIPLLSGEIGELKPATSETSAAFLRELYGRRGAF